MGVMCVYICVIYERLLFDMCTCKFLCVCVCAQEYAHMYFICACMNKMCTYIHVCSGWVCV